MWLRIALLSGALGGCSQIVGIQDLGGTANPPSVDATEPTRDGDIEPPDTMGPGPNACATVPTFGTPNNFAAPDAFTMAAGDINNDNRIDIVYADGSNVFVLKGTGNQGSFAPAVALAGSALPTTGVAIGDIDSDGLADVITWFGEHPMAQGGTNTVRAHRQVVGGTLAAAQTFVVPGLPNTQLRDVKIAKKLDGDANADLVISTTAGTFPYAGNGNGTFTAGAAINALGLVTLAVTDIDGDGFDDIAYATTGGVQIRFNKTATPGTFETGTVVVGSGDVRNAAIGRFSTNSPRKDIVTVVPGPLGLPLFTQNTPRVFTQADPAAIFKVTAPQVSNATGFSMPVADLNGDGKDDVIGEGSFAVQCATGTFFPGDMNDVDLPFGVTPGTSKSAPIFVDVDRDIGLTLDLVQISDGFIKVSRQ